MTVNVLGLQWQHDDLGVGDEVDRLMEVFRSRYGFNTEKREIPSSRPTLMLMQTISSWTEQYDEPGNLFILYYAGHGKIDEGRQVIWMK